MCQLQVVDVGRVSASCYRYDVVNRRREWMRILERLIDRLAANAAYLLSRKYALFILVKGRAVFANSVLIIINRMIQILIILNI